MQAKSVVWKAVVAADHVTSTVGCFVSSVDASHVRRPPELGQLDRLSTVQALFGIPRRCKFVQEETNVMDLWMSDGFKQQWGRWAKRRKKLQPTGMKELASWLKISEGHEAWYCPRRT